MNMSTEPDSPNPDSPLPVSSGPYVPYNYSHEHRMAIKEMHQRSALSLLKCQEWLSHAGWNVDRAMHLAMQDMRRRFPGW